jgi:hypothetical protein
VPHARDRSSSAGIAAFGHLLARSAIPADLLALANKVACLGLEVSATILARADEVIE